MLEKAVLNRA